MSNKNKNTRRKVFRYKEHMDFDPMKGGLQYNEGWASIQWRVLAFDQGKDMAFDPAEDIVGDVWWIAYGARH